MKTTTNIIYAAFTLVALAIGNLTANGAPGDLIAADYNGNVIQVPINPFGTPSLVWDNANLPPHSWSGIAFDKAGNIYLSEDPRCAGCGSIYKLSPDRTTLTLFASALDFPGALAVDSAGNIYVTTNNGVGDPGIIYKFTPQGMRTTFASGLGGGLTFDGLGNLFAGGATPDPTWGVLGAIFKIDPEGAVSLFCTLPYCWSPGPIAFDSTGNLFVLAHHCNGHNIIFEYPPQGGGEPIYHYQTGASPGWTGVVIDSLDNLYIPRSAFGPLGTAAVIGQFVPPYYGSQDPWGPSDAIYVGNGWDPYETLGQLVIQPPAYAAQVQSPINSDGTSIFNARRGVVSVRFALTYGGTATCALPPATIAVTRTAGGVMGNVNESVYTASADTGSNFRINGCQYMYNLDSRALGIGIYRVDIMLNGQLVVGSASFELK